MTCKPNEHDFKEVVRFKRGLWIIPLKDSVYSQCSKCRIVRHDNDGDLIEVGDYLFET